jgi:hypothetical protein
VRWCSSTSVGQMKESGFGEEDEDKPVVGLGAGG